MAKRGRKPKYETHIKPRLDDVKKWAEAGASEKEIATALGVSLSAFSDYKTKYSELVETIRAGRQVVVLNVKAALVKRAVGFEYEEKVGRNKNGELTTEVYQRYSPPDATACAMVLRNYSDEWRDKDKETSEFRRQELEIKKALAESNNFISLS